VSLSEHGQKKKMLIVSAWTSLAGLSEPLFVPDYWNPPSLFGLAEKTGFDIESVIFAFAIGGLAVILYDRIFGAKSVKMRRSEMSRRRHHYHTAALLTAPVVFIALYLATDLNPIYVTVFALLSGGVATWFCRPDLKTKMLFSAVIFTLIYASYFLSLVFVFPDYVPRIWNTRNLMGIALLGIPLEELLFAATFGFYWSTVYEHVKWIKFTEKKDPSRVPNRVP